MSKSPDSCHAGRLVSRLGLSLVLAGGCVAGGCDAAGGGTSCGGGSVAACGSVSPCSRLKVTRRLASGRPAGLGVLSPVLVRPAIGGGASGDDLGVMNSGVSGDLAGGADLAGDAVSYGTSLTGSRWPWFLRGESCFWSSCFWWSCF